MQCLREGTVYTVALPWCKKKEQEAEKKEQGAEGKMKKKEEEQELEAEGRFWSRKQRRTDWQRNREVAADVGNGPRRDALAAGV